MMWHLLLIVSTIAATAGCSTNNSHDKDFATNGNDTLPNNNTVGHYVPLPCAKGIELEKLYGTWRSIGDKYNDATFKYWINKIDTAGNWIIDKVDGAKTTRKYSGKIKSINKDYTIKVESEHGVATLEILNLTANCFEYRHKESKQTWRLDRMK